MKVKDPPYPLWGLKEETSMNPWSGQISSSTRLGRRGNMRDDSAEIVFQCFLQEALVGSSGLGQGSPLFNAVHPAFPLPTTAYPTLQGVMKDNSGEAVVACEIPNHASFRLLTVTTKLAYLTENVFSYKKRFLFAYKKLNPPPHPAGGRRSQETCTT